MTEAELLKQLATKLFNKTEEELTAILYDGDAIKDDAFDNLIQMDVARVTRLKGDSKQRFDDGYKKAQSEIMPNIEKKLKAEFDINDELTFDELIPKVKEKMLAGSKTKLTDDEVKKHPLFIELEKNRIPKDIYDQKISEHEAYKAGIERKTKLDRVKEKAMLHLEEFKPDYPDVPTVKQNLINAYLGEFEKFDDFEFAADGSIIAIKEGKRVEDAHGNVVPFEQLAKERSANWFKFLVQGAKGGAGNGSGKQGQEPVKKYANKEEAVKAYDAATTDEEKKQILKDLGYL